MAEGANLVERTYQTERERVDLTVDAQYRSLIVHDGKGSMEGARAILAMFDEVIEQLGRDHETLALIDIRRLYGAPFRAQFLLGRWLIKNKAIVGRIAVFGGRPWEMKLGRAVAALAGMTKIAGFFNTEAPAREFLGWPRE